MTRIVSYIQSGLDKLLSGPRWKWKALCAILALCLFRAFPDYRVLQTDFFQTTWRDVQLKFNHPLLDTARLFPAGSHESKLTFRLTLPILAHLFHLRETGVLIFTAGTGIVLLYLTLHVAFTLTATKRTALFVCLSIACVWPGEAAFHDLRGGYYDALAICLVLAALAAPSSLAAAAFLFAAFWTDERAIIASAFVFLLYIWKNTGGSCSLLTGKPAAVVCALAAYLGIRAHLAATHSYVTATSGIGLSVLSQQASAIPLAIWTGLGGAWILVFGGLLALIAQKHYRNAAGFSSALLAAIAASVAVADMTRSLCYCLPAVFIALWALAASKDIKYIERLAAISAAVSLLVPTYYVEGSSGVFRLHSLPFQIVQWLCANRVPQPSLPPRVFWYRSSAEVALTRFLIVALACFTAVAFGDDVGGGQVPEIPFDSVPNFLKLPPDLYLGEASGVAINSKKHVFVFSRGNSTGPAYGATAAQILEFGPDGRYIREIGHNLYAWSFAHAIRFDKDDNLWAVDKGSDMIIKFDPQGRVVMVFGRKKEASDEGDGPWTHPNPPRPAIPGQFRQPTDVTWDPQGDIFISDGYINSRVAKFDKNGDWVKQWGTFGSDPGQFNTPHSIASDAKGNIYVADRGNRRIQVFDSDGSLLREITINVPPPPVVHMWMGNPPAAAPAAPVVGQAPANLAMQPGAPWAICVTPGPGTQYLYSADAYPGRIYKLSLDGKVLGVFGSMGHQLKQFGWIHEMACPSENEIYTAEILNWRVQKLILHPAK